MESPKEKIRILKHINIDMAQEKLYPDNSIRTAKYNIITFLPIALINQFTNYFNIFFLATAVILAIPQISPIDPASAISPFLVVLVISLIREAIEDYKKAKYDETYNNSEALQYDKENDNFAKIKWKDISIGKIIKILKNEEVPADILVVKSSLENGFCYLQTTNLDGESALKPREAMILFQDLVKNQNDLEKLSGGVIEIDPPDNNIYRVEGYLILHKNEKKYFDINNILLRGGTLKNVEYIYGIVVYTGKETKIMKNIQHGSMKLSSIDKELNKIVVYIVIFAFSICMICTICGMIFTTSNKPVYPILNMDYIFYYQIDKDYPQVLEIFKIFAAFFAIFNTLIPISVMITLEIVKGMQIVRMERIFNKEYPDEKTKILSMKLHEDLGNVRYIFTDKTGTLTKNEMEFKACSIFTKLYNEEKLDSRMDTDSQPSDSKRIINNEKNYEKLKLNDGGMKNDIEVVKTVLPLENDCEDLNNEINYNFNPNLNNNKFSPSITPKSIFSDKFETKYLQKSLLFDQPIDIVDLGDTPFCSMKDAAMEFFLNIAINHNVLTEIDSKTLEKTYTGANPDEVVLVQAAKEMGVEFIERSNKYIKIKILNEEYQFEILQRFEYSSARMRSSIVIKDKLGVIKLYMKGADSIILKKIDLYSQNFVYQTTKDHLDKFAKEGLRTLCYSMKIINNEILNEWAEEYRIMQGKAILDKNLNFELEEIISKLEDNMLLIGISGLEDKLQDDVKICLQDFIEAGINVWMLTGDKLDTAESIGYSCKLFNDDTEVFKIKATNNKEETLERVKNILEKMEIIESELINFKIENKRKKRRGEKIISKFVRRNSDNYNLQNVDNKIFQNEGQNNLQETIMTCKYSNNNIFDKFDEYENLSNNNDRSHEVIGLGRNRLNSVSNSNFKNNFNQNYNNNQINNQLFNFQRRNTPDITNKSPHLKPINTNLKHLNSELNRNSRPSTGQIYNQKGKEIDLDQMNTQIKNEGMKFIGSNLDKNSNIITLNFVRPSIDGIFGKNIEGDIINSTNLNNIKDVKKQRPVSSNLLNIKKRNAHVHLNNNKNEEKLINQNINYNGNNKHAPSILETNHNFINNSKSEFNEESYEEDDIEIIRFMVDKNFFEENLNTNVNNQNSQNEENNNLQLQMMNGTFIDNIMGKNKKDKKMKGINNNFNINNNDYDIYNNPNPNVILNKLSQKGISNSNSNLNNLNNNFKNSNTHGNIILIQNFNNNRVDSVKEFDYNHFNIEEDENLHSNQNKPNNQNNNYNNNINNTNNSKITPNKNYSKNKSNLPPILSNQSNNLNDNSNNFDFNNLFEHYKDKIKNLQPTNNNLFNFNFQQDEKDISLKNFGLIIEGISISQCLDEEIAPIFWECLKKSRSIICCRCSPIQKSNVVNFVKKQSGEVTLAIGDGGNDVNMIKSANVGVGIFGKEGFQAAFNSDYAISQFKHLRKLLFVHGRFSLMRNAYFIVFFFYKNLIYTFPQFWYNLFNGFSGMLFWDDFFYLMYNSFFSTIPASVRMLVEEDIDITFEGYPDRKITQYLVPDIYKEYRNSRPFNIPKFFVAFLGGILHSIIIYFVPMFIYKYGVMDHTGKNTTLWNHSYLSFTSLMSIQYFIIFEDTFYYNGLAYFAHSVQFILYFGSIIIHEFRDHDQASGIMFEMMNNLNFWLILFLTIYTSIIPVFIIRRIEILFSDSIINNLRHKKCEHDFAKKTYMKKLSEMQKYTRSLAKFKKIYNLTEDFEPDNLADKKIKEMVDNYKSTKIKINRNNNNNIIRDGIMRNININNINNINPIIKKKSNNLTDVRGGINVSKIAKPLSNFKKDENLKLIGNNNKAVTTKKSMNINLINNNIIASEPNLTNIVSPNNLINSKKVINPEINNNFNNEGYLDDLSGIKYIKLPGDEFLGKKQEIIKNKENIVNLNNSLNDKEIINNVVNKNIPNINILSSNLIEEVNETLQITINNNNFHTNNILETHSNDNTKFLSQINNDNPKNEETGFFNNLNITNSLINLTNDKPASAVEKNQPKIYDYPMEISNVEDNLQSYTNNYEIEESRMTFSKLTINDIKEAENK